VTATTSSILRAFAALLLGCASFAGAYTLRTRLNRRYDAARRILDDANIPTPLVASVLSLGHTEWMTDILWVNATLYYGETMVAHLPARYIARYTDTMIALDPDFRRAYLWGAQSLTLRTVAATRADIEQAGDFLRRGIQRFPADPELHLQYGFNRAFDMTVYVQRHSPEWRALRALGGEHLRFAAAAAHGPAWLPLTASGLLRAAGRTRDAILVLTDGLLHTSDPQAVPLIEGRLLELLRDQEQEEDPLFTAVLETVRVRRAVHPWMPPTLHLFVGAYGFVRGRESAPRP
jgi:hypothetical protein